MFTPVPNFPPDNHLVALIRSECGVVDFSTSFFSPVIEPVPLSSRRTLDIFKDMAMAQIRNWGLLALAASFPLAMGQMDHGTMGHSAMSAEPSATDSSSASVETHVVLVGYQGRSFFPNNTKAKAGETVEFQFLPDLEHSVVRADYMWPCIPYEKVGNGRTGFFSGFFKVGKNEASPKWRYTVSDDKPIYFYSSSGDDCNRYGMVGAINAKSMSDLEHQAGMALDSTRVEQPDAALKDQPPMDMSSSSTSTASSTSSPTSTPAPTVTESTSSAGLGAGGIAGVVVGAVAGIALIAGLFYWYGVMRARQKPPTPDTSPMAQSSYLSPGGGAPSSFGAKSATMFSSNGVPSPPPQTHLSPEMASGPFVDGDTIYVPVKRSTMIASGDLSHMPAELYNPAELYHPGVPGQNSDTASWNRGFESQAQSDANSIRHHQTPPPVAQPRLSSRPSELSG